MEKDLNEFNDLDSSDFLECLTSHCLDAIKHFYKLEEPTNPDDCYRINSTYYKDIRDILAEIMDDIEKRLKG